MSRELALSHVTERDIDLLLVEELVCSPGFQEWFLRRVLGAPPESEPVVRHSLSRRSKAEGRAGETDITVTATVGGKRVAVLVENKLDSCFTREQPAECVNDSRPPDIRTSAFWRFRLSDVRDSRNPRRRKRPRGAHPNLSAFSSARTDRHI